MIKIVRLTIARILYSDLIKTQGYLLKDCVIESKTLALPHNCFFYTAVRVRVRVVFVCLE